MRWWALAAVLACGCAAPAPRSARDELLFELPHWCGGARRGWTTWEDARRARPNGAAMCGVRLPSGADDGVCVALRGGKVVDATVRVAGVQRAATELVDLETSRGWAMLESLRETQVQIDGVTLSVRAPGGEREGPCFHGLEASMTSASPATRVRRAP